MRRFTIQVLDVRGSCTTTNQKPLETDSTGNRKAYRENAHHINTIHTLAKPLLCMPCQIQATDYSFKPSRAIPASQPQALSPSPEGPLPQRGLKASAPCPARIFGALQAHGYVSSVQVLLQRLPELFPASHASNKMSTFCTSHDVSISRKRMDAKASSS